MILDFILVPFMDNLVLVHREDAQTRSQVAASALRRHWESLWVAGGMPAPSSALDCTTAKDCDSATRLGMVNGGGTAAGESQSIPSTPTIPART